MRFSLPVSYPDSRDFRGVLHENATPWEHFLKKETTVNIEFCLLLALHSPLTLSRDPSNAHYDLSPESNGLSTVILSLIGKINGDSTINVAQG